MSDISENLKALKNNISEDVKLVAVSKTKPVEDILQAYECRTSNIRRKPRSGNGSKV